MNDPPTSETSRVVAQLGAANAQLRRQVDNLQAQRDGLVDEVCELRRLAAKLLQQRVDADARAVHWAKQAATARTQLEDKIPLGWTFSGGRN